MAQNVYDDEEFFAGYTRLRRAVLGLDGAPEWPAVRGLLPDLAGKRVIDLGCGFGWFCRWAREQGADHVTGMDISVNMLNRARQDTDDEHIEYLVADLEEVELEERAFDLAYSSLALHYVSDLARLVGTVQRSLVPGGRFLFTIEHPIYMAPNQPGWAKDAAGRKSWPVNGYALEGARTTNWFKEGVIKYHRTLGTTLNTLIDTGLTIAHVEEWSPSARQVAELPSLADELERPLIAIVAAEL